MKIVTQVWGGVVPIWGGWTTILPGSRAKCAVWNEFLLSIKNETIILGDADIIPDEGLLRETVLLAKQGYIALAHAHDDHKRMRWYGFRVKEKPPFLFDPTKVGPVAGERFLLKHPKAVICQHKLYHEPHPKRQGWYE